MTAVEPLPLMGDDEVGLDATAHAARSRRSRKAAKAAIGLWFLIAKLLLRGAVADASARRPDDGGNCALVGGNRALVGGRRGTVIRHAGDYDNACFALGLAPGTAGTLAIAVVQAAFFALLMTLVARAAALESRNLAARFAAVDVATVAGRADAERRTATPAMAVAKNQTHEDARSAGRA